MREFLEKNYTDEAIAGDNEAIKLAIRALLEVSSNTVYTGQEIMLFYIHAHLPFNLPLQVVQSGGKNIELAVIRRNQPLKVA